MSTKTRRSAKATRKSPRTGTRQNPQQPTPGPSTQDFPPILQEEDGEEPGSCKILQLQAYIFQQHHK